MSEGDASSDGPSDSRVDLDGSEPPDDEAPQTPVPRFDALAPRRRRWLVALLVVGLLAAAWPLRNLAPRERTIEIAVARHERVRDVELVWVDAEGDVLRATRTSYPTGAPARIRLTIPLRNGVYRLRLVLAREGDLPQELERELTLGDPSFVLVRVE